MLRAGRAHRKPIPDQRLRLHAPRRAAPNRAGSAKPASISFCKEERFCSGISTNITSPSSLHTLVPSRGGLSYDTLCNLSPHPESNAMKPLHPKSARSGQITPLFLYLSSFSPHTLSFCQLYSCRLITLDTCVISDSRVPEYECLIYIFPTTLCKKEISLSLDSGEHSDRSPLIRQCTGKAGLSGLAPAVTPSDALGSSSPGTSTVPFYFHFLPSATVKELASGTVHHAKLSKNAAGLLVPSH